MEIAGGHSIVSASLCRCSRILRSVSIDLFHPFWGEIPYVFSKRLKASMISGLDCTQRNIEQCRDFLKSIVVKKAEDNHRSLFVGQFLDCLRYHLIRPIHQHSRLIPMRLFPREGTNAFKNSESPPALDPKSLHLTDYQAV
ncbi:hypothetical protein D3C78_1503570 [compost metagenome]